MNIYDRCPCCSFSDIRVRVAMHLLSIHRWAFTKGMDWLRAQEESETSRA